MKLLEIALVAGTICLGSCASTVSNLCPQVVDYSPAFQEKLAGEIEVAPQSEALIKVILDYADLRNRLRAC